MNITIYASYKQISAYTINIFLYLRSQKYQKIGSREWFALCVILSFTNLVVCPPPPSTSRKEEDPLFTSKIVSGGKYKTTTHSEENVINDEFRKYRTEVTLPVRVLVVM